MLSTVIKQYALLHKQRRSSARQNIPFKTFKEQFMQHYIQEEKIAAIF